MANFLDKIKVKTAVDTSTKLDLSCNHISTANFMQYNVAWKKELVPGEKIKVNMETFTRLAPMQAPMFGRANIHNRAFFVPFRTIFAGWNDFITDAVHVSANGNVGIGSTVPYFRNRDFVYRFLTGTQEFAELVSNPSEEAYDISVIVYNTVTSSTNNYYKLTSKGRQLLKVMESLGYKFIWICGTSESINNQLPDKKIGDQKLSALPLLAAVKIYFDWYYPSAYVNTETNGQIESILKRDGAIDAQLTITDLYAIMQYMPYVNYDSDYFVSAWDNPAVPNDGTFSSFDIKDPSDIKGPYGSSAYNSITVGPTDGDYSYLGRTNAPVAALAKTEGSWDGFTQFAVDALKSLTDYMKRHQLVGARALDRYLARFGINLPAEKLNRSVYLGSASQPLQIGDVMSTADTSDIGGDVLGNYAGKGISYGAADFEYETDEYGIMLIISTIQPVVGYYQGIDRNNLHLTKLDYWTPEFDNLGTQAIAKQELYLPLADTAEFTDLGTMNDGVFGWIPRYAEYKVAHDRITGDYRYQSKNAGADSWHLMRTISATSPEDLVHNVGFVKGMDASQYSRIFNSIDVDGIFAADKFNVIYNMNVVSYSPMKTLFDTYEFDSKGKFVIEDVNGVKMN